jgi:O-antigen/teichoic acid export membrane protein
VLIFVGHSPTIFFEFQALLAVVEAAVLIFESYRLIPKVESGIRTPWEWGPIKGVLKFSMGVAFTGTVWVFVTQMDKLLLSKLLPLSEYAYFSLAVLAASGITILSVPISSVLLPRMTKLNTENDDEGVIAIYRGATQVVGFLAVPSAFTLILFSQRVLWVWTGNPGVAISAGPILVLYSLGNLCLVYSAFPYYLQFAKGDLKLHVLGNALFLLVLIPSLIWATGRYGAVGAGWAWFGSNLLYLLLWTPVVHRRFSRGVHFRWLFGDLGGVILPVFIGAIVIRQFLSFPPGRMGSAVFVFLQGFLLLGLALAGSSFARGKILERVRAVRTSGGGI